MKRYQRIDIDEYLSTHDCRSHRERCFDTIRAIRHIDPDYGYRKETRYKVQILGDCSLLTLEEWATLCHDTGELWDFEEVTIRINILKLRK